MMEKEGFLELVGRENVIGDLGSAIERAKVLMTGTKK
jgi:hypothetical protein